MDYVTIINYILNYLFIGFWFWIGNAIVTGYIQSETNKGDFYAAILWPIHTAVLLGTFMRLIVEWFKIKKLKKEAK